MFKQVETRFLPERPRTLQFSQPSTKQNHVILDLPPDDLEGLVGEDYIGCGCDLDHGITLEMVQAEHNSTMRSWQRSTSRRALLDIIDKNKPEQGWQIEKVVCIAIGSLCTTNHERNRRSMYQFACAVDTARELERRGHAGGGGLQTFAQDPQYTQVDVEFMAGLGVKWLDPDLDRGGLGAAMDHLGKHSLLFEFGMGKDEEVWEDLYETVNGLHIGHGSAFLRWRVSRNPGYQSNEPEHDVADRFDDRNARCKFPEFEEDPEVFERLWVHWPRGGESNAAGRIAEDVSTT